MTIAWGRNTTVRAECCALLGEMHCRAAWSHVQRLDGPGPSGSISVSRLTHILIALLCSMRKWWHGYRIRAILQATCLSLPADQIWENTRFTFPIPVPGVWWLKCPGLKTHIMLFAKSWLNSRFKSIKITMWCSIKISSTYPNSAPSPWFLFLLQNVPTQAPGMMDSFPLPYLIPTTLRHEEGLGGEGRRCL